MNELLAFAHAKLNLALAVTGRRSDGFHVLRSIFIGLALHDDLRVRLAADARGSDELVVSGDERVPVAGNLVLLAAAAVREMVDRPLPALAFDLHKRIPMQAGLAGGSADAAAALDLALRIWDVDSDPAVRPAIAAGLGADVPFFASGIAAALVSGTGEEIEPLPAIEPPVGILLVTPAEGLSTAAVFAAFDAGSNDVTAALSATSDIAAAMRERRGGDALIQLMGTLGEANDLWPAAAMLAPDVAPLRERLQAAVGRAFHLTGSGSTLFAILPTRADAEATADHLREVLPSVLERGTVHVTTTKLTTAHAEGAT